MWHHCKFYFYLIFYEQLIVIACWSRSMSCLAKSFQQGNVFSKTEYLISLNVWTCAGIVVVKVVIAEGHLGSFILRNIMFKKKTWAFSGVSVNSPQAVQRIPRSEAEPCSLGSHYCSLSPVGARWMELRSVYPASPSSPPHQGLLYQCSSVSLKAYLSAL